MSHSEPLRVEHADFALLDAWQRRVAGIAEWNAVLRSATPGIAEDSPQAHSERAAENAAYQIVERAEVDIADHTATTIDGVIVQLLTAWSFFSDDPGETNLIDGGDLPGLFAMADGRGFDTYESSLMMRAIHALKKMGATHARA